MIVYAAISIAFLVLVIVLVRKSRRTSWDEFFSEADYRERIGSPRWLDLSDRIFDPSDARWLEEELAFPRLAKVLVLRRRRLAIRWLESLQVSFDDLVRTPTDAPGDTPESSPVGSWHLLWLTVRFKFLVSYALVVVKLFGPYHKLMPSFSWSAFARRKASSFQRTLFAESRGSR